MTQDLNRAAHTYVAIWNDKPVAFFAFLPLPSGTVKNAWRGSRTVVLPDYQGLGIGHKVAKYLHSLYKACGKRVYMKSSHPVLVNLRKQDPDYTNGTLVKAKGLKHSNYNWSNKVSDAWSFEYIGEPAQEDTSIIEFDPNAYRGIGFNQQTLF